jgi:hypothetical protein
MNYYSCENCMFYDALDSFCRALHVGVSHPEECCCEHFREAGVQL